MWKCTLSRLRTERVELGQVVRSALETSRSSVERAGHHVTVSLPGEPLYVQGDAVRLAQVFANLLNNAVKYTNPKGRIQITGRREGGMVVVSVHDNGVGISPDMLPRIFDMFAQADPASDRSEGGLGIGLTLVRSLVQLHGGNRNEEPESRPPRAIARDAEALRRGGVAGGEPGLVELEGERRAIMLSRVEPAAACPVPFAARAPPQQRSLF